MCAANGVSKVIAGHNALLSTPAISAVIRKYGALGGFVLTASHNPGGLLGDFGIKFDISNGGAAPGIFTRTVHIYSRHIKSYRTVANLSVDLSDKGLHWFTVDGREFIVEVIDSVEDYVKLMKQVFDFEQLKQLLTEGFGGEPFRVIVDCMYGASGPYAQRIFCEELGAPPESVINGVPVSDFGGLMPDPNLTRATQILQLARDGRCDLGAAIDGDGDRNLLVGRGGFFVPPADSLAVLAAHLCCIRYFYGREVRGVARSMPTAAAVDRVAHELGLQCYEVPTGWKHFVNLMDAGLVSLCGEESFGTSSCHIREKDGLWAVMAWLSVVADLHLSVREIVTQHWQRFGRHYFKRYDFEKCNRDQCRRMMFALEQLVASGDMIGECYGDADLVVESADKYRYVDPVDGFVTTDQGVRVVFEGGSRLVFRLGGTDSTGSTVRVYCERYEADPGSLQLEPDEVVQPLLAAARDILRLQEFTGRTEPDVVT